MKLVRYPSRNQWAEFLKRPVTALNELTATVDAVLADVKLNGDSALRRYTSRFDGIELDRFCVTVDEISRADKKVPETLKKAIKTAAANIERFHSAQARPTTVVETTKGVTCWQKAVPIQRVGIYVPGGTAPLFSTVLMLAIPARLAGCDEIVVCTPPDDRGAVNEAILYTAALCGVTKVYKVGGAQAIAALAYGTETIPKVDKIFGPGNRYVTLAKQRIFRSGVAIDMPAGPSEVLVLADDSAIPEFVAADLLSQAEHGSDSQAVLISTSETVISKTLIEVEKQLADLPRHHIATASLTNSMAILVESLETGLELVNEYAPEHLVLAVENVDETAEGVVNAGSVFLGNYSCESAGDYASGTNHTLPTAGFARSFSGVSLESFVKKITFQKLTADGLRNLGPAIETMASAEGLEGHRRAVSIRLEAMNGV